MFLQDPFNKMTVKITGDNGDQNLFKLYQTSNNNAVVKLNTHDLELETSNLYIVS